jgi:hypothetical protein
MNHPQAEQVKSGSAIGIVNNEALQKLNQEGAELGEQVVAVLSPYVRQHINRFGRYQLDLTQPPPPLNYDIRVIFIRAILRFGSFTKVAAR